MKKQDKYFELYKLKEQKRWKENILDVPILVLLWYLGYSLGFWILVSLIFLNALCHVYEMGKLREKAELKWM